MNYIVDRAIRKLLDRIVINEENDCVKIGTLLIQWGTASKTVGANTGANTHITFREEYKKTPAVFANSTVTTNFPGLWTMSPYHLANTGFDLSFHNQYSQVETIQGWWIAFGISSGGTA